MDPFIGQIVLFAGNFAPRGWALCEGQLLPISSNSALFSILGTTYGGDGRTTFALPDFRGRTALQHGAGPGLTTLPLGAKGGAESISITANNLPSAPVSIPAIEDDASSDEPSGNAMALSESSIYGPATGSTSRMADGTLRGGNQPIQHRPPYLTCNFIIALVGVFPSRN